MGVPSFKSSWRGWGPLPWLAAQGLREAVEAHYGEGKSRRNIVLHQAKLGQVCLWRMSDGSRTKNDLNVKEVVTFGPEGSAAVESMLGRCWNECANARDYLCLACRHTEPDWL